MDDRLKKMAKALLELRDEHFNYLTEEEFWFDVYELMEEMKSLSMINRTK